MWFSKHIYIMQNIEAKQDACTREIQRVNQVAKVNRDRVERLEYVVRQHEGQITVLSYRSINIDARSRRNNILF